MRTPHAWRGLWRLSARIQAHPNADATCMERAMELAHARENTEGIKSPSKLSIFNIPDCAVVAMANNLGVSLGQSSTEINSSVANLKNIDKERNFTRLYNNLSKEDEQPHNLFVSKVSGLCDDLADEDSQVLDDQTDLIGHEPNVTKRRKKGSVDKSKLRRSVRLKNKINKR